MKLTNGILTVLIILLGAGAAYFVWNTEWFARTSAADEHEGGHDDHGHGGHDHDEHAEGDEVERGVHGGRLLHGDGLDLEITIFEAGIPPEYRVYPYVEGKPVPPGDVNLTILLERLGGRTDTITFAPEGEYLRGAQVVEEPHSFDVSVKAQYLGTPFEWEYESHEGRVEIAEERARESGIEAVSAGPAVIRSALTFPGEIALDQNRIVHVVPRLSGVVREVNYNLGEVVRAGDLLAVIDSRELADAKSEFLASLERRELAQSRNDREKSLYEKKISSEEDYLTARQVLAEENIEVRKAEQKLMALGLSATQISNVRSGKDTSLTDYAIHAPIDGTIIEKHMSIGEAIAGDAPVFLIADLATVRVEAVVYAADLQHVREGQTVTVRSNDIGANATGTVSYIGSLIGQETRTAKAFVELDNSERIWRPGLFVSVDVATQEAEAPVAVPLNALQTFRDWDVVFIKVGDTYEVRPVERGRSDGSMVEIVSGLAPGELYVAKNSYVIKADIEKAGASHNH